MYLVCIWAFNIFVHSISVILSEIAFTDYEAYFGDFKNFLNTRKLRHRDIKWCNQNHTSSESGSHSVVSDSLWPHGLQHARPPGPSLTPGVYPNSCPLSQWCHPIISSLSSPTFNLPDQRLFKWVSSSHQVPKYWSFSYSISSYNEYAGLVSFRIDWLDILAVQGTHKSLLPHHSSKASILWRSAFFIVQVSHPYMTTGFD